MSLKSSRGLKFRQNIEIRGPKLQDIGAASSEAQQECSRQQAAMVRSRTGEAARACDDKP